MNTIQIFLKPCEGKALIADALVSREDIQTALRQHTVILIAGTTNAWLAKAISRCLGAPEFEASGFCRGAIRGEGPTVQNKKTPFDFIVRQGEILSEQTIFDVADTLSGQDIILKGANAVNLRDGSAGVLIGAPSGGTIIPILQAALGRRTKLIHPVGVEKRVTRPIRELAALVNATEAEGLRLLPTPGIPYTELDALRDLFGVKAELIASGGVDGCEGGCLFQLDCSQGADSTAIRSYFHRLRLDASGL